MSNVFLANRGRKHQPKLSYSILQLLNSLWFYIGTKVDLHGSPDVFDRIEIRTRDWSFPPVHVFLFKVVLCPSAGMFRVIILLKTVTHGIMLFNETALRISVLRFEDSREYDYLCCSSCRNSCPNMNFGWVFWYSAESRWLTNFMVTCLSMTFQLN